MSEPKRIEVQEFEDETQITVFPKIEGWQLSALAVWNGLWFLCGLIMVWQLFQPVARDMKLFAFTYLLFWGWFLYKGIYFYFWKRYGRERIRLYPEGIQYKKDINGYGKVHTYQAENVSNIQAISLNKRSFGWSYQQSFWMPGNETVGFEYFGKIIGFGKQLNDREQHELLKKLKYKAKKYLKS